ncbi:type I restriction-modification system methyltransferase subunit [Bernardetia litoralis DSM 6794]|uniref:site-specific DNA-methyltransferase (adenine-specific) n=1 Tax=Bernardetia litoralis (strain ATCC 23117 / DSM 6794 / NBRC 15988 / NCIMB 1366 / Fx l1 / Sio-4) TaxID=880071 RepID=I4AQE4_BERLS|nr:TaqI-like C-terminal specificity domain-containing protein [Bernardetia litoralis]AFM06179.1 type I restriction-modification system methyltransferase subunit [Bernardetia litoralis DSM 6794]
MNIITKPSKVLNPAYRKINVTRNEINNFKSALNVCLEHIRISEEKNESEENIKKYVGDFLHQAFYQNYLINTKDKIDLAIYAGKDATSNISVLIEAKRPSNKSEFLKIDNLNRKALQELLLYYLRERVTLENNQIKYLIATNGNEWYFFKGEDFYNTFYKNKKLLKEYNEFISGQKDSSKNELFYNEIAKKYIEEVKDELPFLYIDIKKDFQEFLSIENTDDDKLVSLYKVFSPIHLLAQSYGNDSNQLNKEFYYELLHIIGLEEVKEKGKKVIQRKEKGTRNEGSLLETTIFILDDRDYLRKVENLKTYGQDKEEQLFNVALELCLTWINRILFLKLLESQLVVYNQDSKYKFLNTDFITGYDDLEELFFSALAKKIEDRNERIKEKYNHIPYLNSSLFEPNELEDKALQISNLKEIDLELYDKTVLKNNLKRLTGGLPTLEYIFRFLEAYDFSGEKGEQVDESNQAKTLISASVLGLIFEKINGYKDGSFYTPAYITMYMAKEALRRAVVQKFNTHYTWKCSDFEQLKEDLKDYIRNGDREIIRKEANKIINSLKICDPAVGSGHFLVSALNELIAIKSELGVLIDKDGKRLNAYIQIDNDELIIEDENEEIFTYKPKNKTSQRLQETLFHEKQSLIESCLFGVDINPNSVKICRLRLWIELLKNAYYTQENQLQTLPNIDINIKTGNSLISRFELDEDLKNAFKSKDNPYSLNDYKNAVQEYKNTNNKERKREIIKIIDTIKSAFTGTLDGKFKKKIASARGKLEQKQTEVQNLEAFGEKISKKLSLELKKLKLALNKAQDEKEGLLNNVIYQNAFEWRFEFPEVLNKKGEFVGFDVVIGNPPYGYSFLSVKEKNIFKIQYDSVHQKMFEVSTYFTKRGYDIIKKEGSIAFICPNNLIFQLTFEKFRNFLLESTIINTVINLGDKVFDEADVPTCIFIVTKGLNNQNEFIYGDIRKNESIKIDGFQSFNQYQKYNQNDLKLGDGLVFGIPQNLSKLIVKVSEKSIRIDELANTVSYGISSGGDSIFRIKDDKVEEYQIEEKLLHKVVSGGNIVRYRINYEQEFIIYTVKSTKIEDYKNTLKYLEPYETKLSNKRETKKGTLPWWCLHWPRNVNLYSSPKIILRQTADTIIASLDNEGYFVMDSVMIIKIDNKEKYPLLLGILNSKLNQFIYKTITQETGRVFAQVKPANVRKLFFPLNISIAIQAQLTELINQILSSKKQNPNTDTSDYENEIDILVYKLYDLSYEEVLLIDSDFGLSEEEYNK